MTAAHRVVQPYLPVKNGARILMYHAVGTDVDRDTAGLYNIPPARFESHMRILAEREKNSLRSLDLVSLSSTGSSIMVTFDDGFRDNLTTAAPLLVQLGIPFTVFVTTGPMLAGAEGMLNSDDLRVLDSLPGATIGAHGVTHARLAECGNKQLKEELSVSKACLEDILGHRINSMSYPHGSVNKRVRDAAEDAGYKIGATSRFDNNTPGRDPLLLSRTDIWSKDSERIFLEKLAGYWDWRRLRHRDPALN